MIEQVWDGAALPLLRERRRDRAGVARRSAIRGDSGPYILVGHSFGGLVVQRFANLYGPEVAGVVLVDALSAAEFCPLSDEPQANVVSTEFDCHAGARPWRGGESWARAYGSCWPGIALCRKLAARLTSGGSGSGFTDRLAGELRKLPSELWPVIAWHWSQEKNFEGMARHLECLPESAEEMASLRSGLQRSR